MSASPSSTAPLVSTRTRSSIASTAAPHSSTPSTRSPATGHLLPDPISHPVAHQDPVRGLVYDAGGPSSGAVEVLVVGEVVPVGAVVLDGVSAETGAVPFDAVVGAFGSW